MKTIIIVLTILLSALALEYTRVSVSFSNYRLTQIEEQRKLLQVAADLEKEHAVATDRNSTQLTNIRSAYESTINSINNEYNDRMLNLQKRTEHYRSLSQTNSTGCTELADHRDRLDRLIEEGRYLVIELREELTVRNKQLKVALDQIQTDRQLLEGSRNNE